MNRHAFERNLQEDIYEYKRSKTDGQKHYLIFMENHLSDRLCHLQSSMYLR